MIFLHDRDHAFHADTVIRFVGNGYLVFKYRILYIVIYELYADPVIFFINPQ